MKVEGQRTRDEPEGETTMTGKAFGKQAVVEGFVTQRLQSRSWTMLQPTLQFVLILVAAVLAIAPGGATLLAVPSVDEVAADTSAPTSVTPRQAEWLKASLDDRILLSELRGEEGARTFARQNGLEPIMNGMDKIMPQGPDQVYRGADDVIHVIEAKGGSSPLGNAYGYPQGTPEWSVKSAERVLKSTKASAVEKNAAEAILKAAAKGKLQVDVIRTELVLGEPKAPALQQSLKCTEEATKLATQTMEDLGLVVEDNAPRIAQAIEDVTDATAAPRVVKTVEETAEVVEQALIYSPKGECMLVKVFKGAGKVVLPVGLAADTGIRVYYVTQQLERVKAGELSPEECEIEVGKTIAGLPGGWVAAIALGEVGAECGAALGTVICPGPGTVVFTIVGGAAFGVVGYFAGEKAAEIATAYVIDRIHTSGTTVKAVANKAWDATKTAALAGKDGVVSAANSTGEAAQVAGAKVAEAATTSWDATKTAALTGKDGVVSAANSTGKAAQVAGIKVAEAATTTWDATGESAEAAYEWSSDKVEQISGTTRKVGSWAKGLVSRE
jgi:hypothetical protein